LRQRRDGVVLDDRTDQQNIFIFNVLPLLPRGRAMPDAASFAQRMRRYTHISRYIVSRSLRFPGHVPNEAKCVGERIRS
jgi:hypothetical protein